MVGEDIKVINARWKKYWIYLGVHSLLFVLRPRPASNTKTYPITDIKSSLSVAQVCKKGAIIIVCFLPCGNIDQGGRGGGEGQWLDMSGKYSERDEDRLGGPDGIFDHLAQFVGHVLC
jgi:hypothetical protein